MNADVVVIGGGLVGAAIAYGLVRRNVHVLVIDGGDRDFRATTANFGLVWAHGKGLDVPTYQQLSGEAVDLWPKFSAELTETTGIDLQYEHNGGVKICFGEDEFERQLNRLKRLHNQLDGRYSAGEMLDRSGLSKLFPKVEFGPEVAGASFGPRDGHVNPLRLLMALNAAIIHNGGQVHGGNQVSTVVSDGDGGFIVSFGQERVHAAKVVIAAGLGTGALAAQLGLKIPVRPQRGQILVTERLQPLLPLPMLDMRQTAEGTVMMGATHDDVGFDASTRVSSASDLSREALRCIPALGQAHLVRQWAGLRILTPDGSPIYARSEMHPGVFVAVCHSGVTLAALHCEDFANAVVTGHFSPSLKVFSERRFDVSKAA